MHRCQFCGCGEARWTVLAEYSDDLIGAPFKVIIEDAVEAQVCAHCGKILKVTLPNLASLIAAVAMARAAHPLKLTPAEAKFLRKAAGWTARKLAKEMAVSLESVSRWEHEHRPLSESHERHLRLLVCWALFKHAPLMNFDPDELSNLKIIPVRPADLDFEMRCWRADPSEARGDGKWSIAERPSRAA